MNLIEQIKVNDVSIDGYQGTFYSDNPEWVRVIVDSDEKVLEGIKQDGTKVISGDFKVLGNMEVSGVSYKVIENPEYLAAWVDASDKVIFGLKADGKTYIGDADFLNDIKNNQEAVAEIKSTLASISSTIEPLDIDALSSITAVESPEFIEAKTDSEGKILAGRTPDGAAFENVGFSSPKVSTESVDIDGHIVENIEDPEGRTEIKTDSEGKILSYRDSEGILVENIGIKVNRLIGYNANSLDWSNAKELHIPMPNCIKVNFSGISMLPQAKFVNMRGYMEFWDMQGNYFKKEVILNAQGRSSLSLPKKNIALDICNNNGWDDDDTFKLTIGDWVPQDSFHMKGYMNDYLRCFCPVVYKLYDEIVKTRGEQNDYVWKKALIDFGSITETSIGNTSASDQMTNGARCFPQGIPCIAYLNGEFYGIFSWQLKKHRDNYYLDKKEAKHVYLDGVIGNGIVGYNFFDANGDTTKIDWSGDPSNSFEIRNPKNLYLMNGTKYDADTNPGELMDETSQYYDFTNKDHKRSINVKKYILNLSKVMNTLANAYAVYEASSKTAQDVADFKAVFETYFDVDNLIDYLIISEIVYNWDGFSSNWQWLTYNGVKWYIGLYDVDCTFGNKAKMTDTGYFQPITYHITDFQYQYLVPFYNDELNLRYRQLRQSGLITKEHITGLISSWLSALGNKDIFEAEHIKWPDIREPDSIFRVSKWLETSISNMDVVYHYNEYPTLKYSGNLVSGNIPEFDSTSGVVIDSGIASSDIQIKENNN